MDELKKQKEILSSSEKFSNNQQDIENQPQEDMVDMIIREGITL